MNIKSLERDKFKTATVELNYDEIRCVCNSLYELSKNPNIEKEPNLNTVFKSFIGLFSLVKDGCIPDFELTQMYNLCKQTDKQTNNKKEGSEIDE